jgi:hypothetical protein
MKKTKIIAILLIVTLTIAIAGCSSQETNPTAENEINMYVTDSHGRRDTPIRVASGIMEVMLTQEYTLDILIEDSDIIADITILEWLGESESRSNTFFRAKVNSTLKGEIFEEITLIQAGGSRYTIKGHALFKNNDRMLVFLTKSDAHDDKYWLTACWASTMSIVKYEDKPYFLNGGGWIIWDFLENDDVKKIDGELRIAVNEELLKQDDFLAASREANLERELQELPDNLAEVFSGGYSVVFDYDDVVNVIVKMAREGEAQ